MSAAARAEARRKAILSRGTDRLAKLTTTARGDDPAYKHDDPPLPSLGTSMRPSTSAFLGEESPTPPQRVSPSPSPSSSPASKPAAARQNSNTSASAAGPDFEPGVWSTEQQQLMQALMGGMMGGQGAGGMNAGAGPGAGGVPPSLADNPLAALLMSGLSGAGAGPGAEGLGGVPPLMPPGLNLGKGAAMGGTGAAVDLEPPKPKTLLQRLMPLAHLVAVWVLLAYFALFREPQVHEESVGTTSVSSGWQGVWMRWADLAKRNPLDRAESTSLGQGWTVAAVPFFWAFITLQIGLHSVRIFSGFDRIQPPMLLSMALPHLPAPIPSIIVNGMKYLQMASIFFDDFALAAVGMGFLIWLAGLLSS